MGRQHCGGARLFGELVYEAVKRPMTIKTFILFVRHNDVTHGLLDLGCDVARFVEREPHCDAIPIRPDRSF